MKDTDKLFLGPLGLAWGLSLIFLVLLLITTGTSITSDTKGILLANIQLNGVLFGFVATLSAFVFRRVTGQRLVMSLAYATTAFLSFFFSLVFSFSTLLVIERALLVFELLPICFTLSGIITTIAFIVDITLRAIRQKDENEKS